MAEMIASGGGGGPSAAQIQVAYDALHTAAAQLRAATRIAEEVSGHSRSLTGLAAGAGQPAATAAIESFLHRWGYGLSCLHSDASHLASALESTAARYAHLEHSIASAGGK